VSGEKEREGREDGDKEGRKCREERRARKEGKEKRARRRGKGGWREGGRRREEGGGRREEEGRRKENIQGKKANSEAPQVYLGSIAFRSFFSVRVFFVLLGLGRRRFYKFGGNFGVYKKFFSF
jgi:hypothetical protein